MAGTLKWYGNGLLKLVTGAIDLDTDTFKVMLTTNAYTPDQDVHNFRDDVTNEVAGTNYVAGGAAITVASVTYDAASNQVRIVFNDVTWATATITARTAVIYKSRGGASSADELLAYVTEATDISSTGATFTLDMPAVPLTITAA